MANMSQQQITGLRASFDKERGSVRRAVSPTAEDLTVELMGLQAPVNCFVGHEACLRPIPHYVLPSQGKLKEDIWNVLVSLIMGLKSKKTNTVYVWGIPGTGKDALFHFLASTLGIPSKKFSIQPGADISHWMYSRSFDASGTKWEEGDLLKAIRDGHTDENGKQTPMLILLSDFDRADRSQAEILRTVMDSDNGQIVGPEGKVYPVLEGTMICATANSMGGGDERGRCISANVQDASLIDRFRTPVQFHAMAWDDERQICEAKFPHLVSKYPDALDMVGRVTQSIRSACEKEEIYSEFSHRAVDRWLAHCSAILTLTGTDMQTTSLLKSGFRVILDGQADSATRLAVKRLADPILGTI